jgi:PiT family inorganic phosphate transporter
MLAALAYLMLRRLGRGAGVTRGSGVCVGRAAGAALSLGAARAAADAPSGQPVMTVMVGPAAQCQQRSSGRVVGVNAQVVVEGVHHASAAAVCFARALNDTPKIAALLLVGGALEGWKVAVIAAAMAAGGVLQARRVGETMSSRITALNAGQGLAANLVTALLVVGASRLALPVSTTHVSVGSIFGIGLVAGGPRWTTVGQVAVVWLTTLPLGGLLGAGLYFALTRLGA